MQLCHIPLLRESRPGQKWPWRHTESVNGTFTKVTQLALPSSKFLFPVDHRGYQNSTLPEISPWVSIKFPNSSPFLLVSTPHWEGAASPIKTFHFQVSLSSILQMTHPLALIVHVTFWPVTNRLSLLTTSLAYFFLFRLRHNLAFKTQYFFP